LGAYLSAYLGDVELTPDNAIQWLNENEGKKMILKNADVDGKPKKFIKGGRLHLYPPKMNIYRKSKGIKEPDVDWITYGEAKKIVGAATPHYTEKINLYDSETDEKVNSIYYEQYNLKKRQN
jgi:hypothetical protein